MIHVRNALSITSAFILLSAAAVAGERRPLRAVESPPPPVDVFGRVLGDVDRDGVATPIPLVPASRSGAGSPARADDAVVAQFQPYVLYPLAFGAEAVAIGDVTGDGLNDVVAVNTNTDSVYVLAQDPSGILKAPVRYAAPITYQGTFSGSVDVADMNRDGRLDVVVTLDNAIGVMLQTATGVLAAPVAYASAHLSFTNTYKVRAGDFNKDGRMDAVSLDWGTQSQDVDVFRQTAAGVLAAPQVYTVGHGGYDDLAVGDVTGDHRTDIVVMSGQLYAYENLGILAQNGVGGLAPPVYYRVNGIQLTSGVGIGDVNHDGRSDVVVSYGGNRPGSYIALFLQSANGQLLPAVDLPSYDIPQPVEVADVNRDGRDDVVTLHGGWMQLGFYLQNASGGLEPEALYPIPYVSHYNRHGLSIGDVNNDFIPDAVIADPNIGIEVLYNAGSPPTAAQASLVSADVSFDRVDLVWEARARPGTTATIERSDMPGAWHEIGAGIIDGSQRVRYSDRDVVQGGRYGYRIGFVDGEAVGAGEVWVDVARLTLALQGSRRNPSGGRLDASITLPVAAPATLEVVDMAGRRIAWREVGSLGPGTHAVDMTPEGSLAAGVYWLRLVQGSGLRTAKVAVLK